MTNKNILKVLFVEDLPSDVDLAVLELRKEGLQFEHKRVDLRNDFIKALNEFRPDIVISDYSMPEYDGSRALKDTREFDSLLPFILCTGSINEETAVECIKAGATDYVIKEHLTRLPFAVKEALEQHRILIEKRAAELLLRENEEKLQSIFRAAPVGIGLMINRVFIEVNDTFCKMTGYSRKELIGKSSELIYATKKEFENDGAEKYRQISEKGIGSVETRFKCKNGKILNIFLSSAPLDKEDLTRGVSFTAMDITERKLAEEEILEKDQKLLSIYDTVGDVIYHLAVETDENYRFISVNHAFCTITGLSEEMVIGKLVKEVIPEPSLQMVLGKYRQAIREKSILRWEETSDYPNGRLTGDVSIAPVIDDKGRCTHLVGSVHDITKRKLAEEALHKSQHLFQTLALVSPVGIFRTNPDGYTTYVNPKWLELSGLTSEESIGLGWLKAVHPDDREQLEGIWKKDVKSQLTSIAEYRFLKPDGSIVWVMGNAVPEWIDNEIAGYIGTITDITERKQAEKMLSDSESSLRSAQEIGKMGSWEWDLVTQETKWSDNYFAIHGYKPRDVIPGFELFRNRVYPDDVHILDEAHATIMKEKTPFSFELRLILTDGTVKWIQNNISPVIKDDQVVKLKGVIIDITERKRAQEALVESEIKYRQLVTRSPDGIFIVDLSGKFLSVNMAICDNLKYSEEELLSMNIWNIVPEKYHALNKQRLVAIMNGESTNIPAEYEVTGKDEIAHPVEVLSVPYYKEKQIIGFQGIARDITERKKEEDILRTSEERLKILFDYAPDAYYLNDPQGNLTDGNIAAEKLLGYPKSELIGKNFLKLNLLSAKQVPRAAKLLINNLLGKGTGPDEFVLNRKDGSKVDVEIITHPVKIKNKILTLGIARDITERKLTEKALRESEEKYRSIFENVQDLYYEASFDGTILDVSPSIDVLSKGQYHRKDLIGKSMFQFYADTGARQLFLSALKEKGSILDYEVVLKNRDGSLIPCSISSKITFDAHGQPEKIIGSMRDITERKKDEVAIVKAKEKAEESDRLKTAFLHNISHEIRTPMNAIVGFSALLGEPDISAKTQQSYIETIMQSSDHLLSIISDIVDISNIEANLVKTVKNAIDVNSTVKSICNQFLPKAGEKNIKLECEYELSGRDALVFTDSTKLTQILSNLLSNAVKFTDAGSIRVRCKKTDDFLEFSISDTGIGISPEFQEKIFDRFFQVQNTVARLYEGTGLGLSISKAYVELMGGKFRVSSEPGKGTTFFFTIPYERQIIEPLPVIEKVVNGGLAFPENKTILVAEDIDSNFKLITYFLSGAKTKLLRATTGKEAVEIALSEKNIDLILMDIKMPEMDGYTAARLIREANIRIPIVAQTAYADDMEKAIENGCNGFISKPFDKKGLLHVLAEFI